LRQSWENFIGLRGGASEEEGEKQKRT
jgi:hypothetical protein